MTQEEKKVQELLKPRVKVIAPWPEMERWLARVGDILTDPGGNETVRNQNGDAVPAFEWETFPHLFRKLEWWEERTKNDLPYYISTIGKKDFYKILMVSPKTGEFVIDNEECVRGHLSNFLPATLAEYHAYISSPELK